MEINGKVALVTGGAVRVGKAISLELAKAGAAVIVNYSSSAEEAQKTVQEIEALGSRAIALQADISNWESVQSMFEEIHEALGKVDILVNNSSPFLSTPIPTTDMDAWHLVTSVQINGAFYVSNLAAIDMMDSKQGCIVNIVDLSAYEAWPRLTAHAVGKSALLTLTRQFALECRPYVRVNAIAPGPVLPPPDYSPEKIEETAHKTLLNRWGEPEDISRTVKFLIESNYINGETIIVDGGEHHAHRKSKQV